MKIKVLVTGVFDVLHPGHLRMLKFAKSLGDELIVGIYGDKFTKINSKVKESYRKEMLENSIYVNKVYIFDSSLEKFILKIKPKIIVKGNEFQYTKNPEEKILNKINASLIFHSGENIFSSLDLLKSDFDINNYIRLKYPFEFINRHSASNTTLKNTITKFNNLKVCVVGDLILDEYIICEPLGMSREDPSVVFTPINKELFVGGAGIVSMHASSLGAKVDFISVSGKDSYTNFAKRALNLKNINHTIIIDKNRKTLIKKRFRTRDKNVFKLSHINHKDISIDIQNKIYSKIRNKIKKYDALLFSDFNYGCLPKGLVDKITTLCKKNKVKIFADSQSSSQYGDIQKYSFMDTIFPTEYEARTSLKNFNDGLFIISDKLLKLTKSKNIILKLGSEGILINGLEKNKSKKYLTDKIDGLNINPKDFNGAGDCLFVVSSLAYCIDENIWKSALLGSISAAIQISKLGNNPIQLSDLLSSIKDWE